MLNYYITQTQRLLQNPGAPVSLYSTADLTSYINVARAQISRRRALHSTYWHADDCDWHSHVSILVDRVHGSWGAKALSMCALSFTMSVQEWRGLKCKSWPWFEFQRLNNPVPTSGAPTEWAQHAQGGAGTGTITNVGAGTMSSGSLWLDPLPDLVYTLNCDATCYPIALVADTDAEAIPFMWSDCVPYFAAYLALMGSQTSTRIQQAQQLFALYEQFMQRARDFANPDPNNFAFEQSPDPFKRLK